MMNKPRVEFGVVAGPFDSLMDDEWILIAPNVVEADEVARPCLQLSRRWRLRLVWRRSPGCSSKPARRDRPAPPAEGPHD